jgi:outer membrane beta-barrel protein
VSRTNVQGCLHDADACTARPLLGVSMKYASGSIALAALVGATLYGIRAVAQVQARTQSVESYAGELFGDDLTDTPVSGRTPRLNDNAIFGARYTYNFTAMWGLQLSGGYSPNRAARVMSGKDNLGLTTVDLDAVWNIMPEYAIVPYVLVGAGYAWAKLDSPITGEINGRPVVLTESNGFTANVGVGAKYFVMGNLFVNVEARYRYLNRLVSNSNQSLNTTETTLGIGWRF